MADDSSIMPVVYEWIQDGARHTLDGFRKKHGVICNDNGVTNGVENGVENNKEPVNQGVFALGIIPFIRGSGSFPNPGFIILPILARFAESIELFIRPNVLFVLG